LKASFAEAGTPEKKVNGSLKSGANANHRGGKLS